MDSFKFYNPHDVSSYVKKRVGEVKLGEKILTISSWSELANCIAAYVLVGIPEDIGVRANHGIGGASTAWHGTLSALLNIQSNNFLIGNEILLLGHFEIDTAPHQDIPKLRRKTAEIDELVVPVLEKIFRSGKIPIVIGGGHNNAFPIIKAHFLALGNKVNVINIDAHADFRDPAEGRHSGNGFSTAFESGFLNEYRVFGLHQNYIHPAIAERFETDEKFWAIYFEEILGNSQETQVIWDGFISDLPEPCALEIDLDSIKNTLSSAASSSGFDLNEIRKLLLTNKKLFSYLHLCEGATTLADGRTDFATGKTIAYLITDFIKALLPRISRRPLT